MSTNSDSAVMRSFAKATRRVRVLAHPHQTRHAATVYQITDRLHDNRAARVSGDDISATAGAWLAEFGLHSPLVDQLAHAVVVGDWPTTHALSDRLLVDITVAA
ncbi:hypothetical protein [Mycobacterium sp. MMS18-G62]